MTGQPTFDCNCDVHPSLAGAPGSVCCRTCDQWDTDDMNQDCAGNALPDPPIGYCAYVEHCTRPNFGNGCDEWRPTPNDKLSHDEPTDI